MRSGFTSVVVCGYSDTVPNGKACFSVRCNKPDLASIFLTKLADKILVAPRMTPCDVGRCLSRNLEQTANWLSAILLLNSLSPQTSLQTLSWKHCLYSNAKLFCFYLLVLICVRLDDTYIYIQNGQRSWQQTFHYTTMAPQIHHWFVLAHSKQSFHVFGVSTLAQNISAKDETPACLPIDHRKSLYSPCVLKLLLLLLLK